MDIVFEVWGDDIRLVMKAKGFVWFSWMFEHSFYLRRKDLYANRFNGEKLQANKISFDYKDR